ncbi:hypothetical protein MAHJHV64_45460 [Mycobacterium avium subsp. hominissuis]|uniref:Uncharacterized protein n=1 Tax=Mycobacterium avium subsp. hominissuis TaxID=439334 RepID=A0AAI8SND9_MYCAV|nr:hypothetical protein O974_13630 [Mycobacterium avium 11-0986]BAN31439.1 hypothetical protein MAH_2365 [Mycobacterium avium subsp. hominissuis TH135]BBN48313.1 hypothetical protein JPH1_27880 [Mycobacterium avium subsp. hominissuis]
MFCPNTFVACNCETCIRFAAINGGGTDAANAASYAAAAARAWLAASSACAAVVLIHPTYGATADAIDADADPNHSSLASAVTTLS